MARIAVVTAASREAEAIRWLLLDETSYVAGAVLPVTGAP
jgi:hypothetical protein